MGRVPGIESGTDGVLSRLDEMLAEGKITRDKYRRESRDHAAIWLESHAPGIDGMDKFLATLRNNLTIGHLVHAQFLVHLIKTGHRVTAVEKTDPPHDIDIQLDTCNIQVWHGQTFTSFMAESGRAYTTELGGVRTFPAIDGNKIKKKLCQLPPDKLGILFVFLKTPFDWISPAFNLPADVKSPKCIVTVIQKTDGKSSYSSVIVYEPQGFEHSESVRRIVKQLGWEHTSCQISND